MKHVGAWLGWFVALWWLWFLLVGEWNAQQWVAASAAAAVVATLAEFGRARADASAPHGVWLAVQAPGVVPMVVIDFGLLIWALLRRTSGEFRTADARNPWAALLATYSPNSYVVSSDEIHLLVPFDRSQAPV